MLWIIAFFAETCIAMTLWDSKTKWVQILGFILSLPFMVFILYMIAQLVYILLLSLPVLIPFVGVILFFCIINDRRKDGIDMIFEGGYWEGQISRKENSHPKVDAFIELQNKNRIIIKEYGDRFYKLITAYVGNKWKIEPFLKLIQGSIWEIVNGYYTEDDKQLIFDDLCELEYEAIDFYNRSWQSIMYIHVMS